MAPQCRHWKPVESCHNSHLIIGIMITVGLNSPSGKTSYRQTPLSLEAARLDVIMIVSFWKLRHLGSAAAEIPVKFQSDWKSLNTNIAASRLNEILWYHWVSLVTTRRRRSAWRRMLSGAFFMWINWNVLWMKFVPTLQIVSPNNSRYDKIYTWLRLALLYCGYQLCETEMSFWVSGCTGSCRFDNRSSAASDNNFIKMTFPSHRMSF